MNPVLSSVPAAFVRVPARPRAIAIDRRGIELPKGGHFQGIQRIGRRERIVITSSSDLEAYCVICDIDGSGTRGRAKPPITLGTSPLNHAGGCQTAQNIMAVGVENFNSRSHSEIQLWDLTAARPAVLPNLTIERKGAPKISSAGAVGITSYLKGAALAVGTWDCDTIDFYTSPANPFQGSASKFGFLKTWTRSGADKSGWIDENFGAYQSVNLLTQADGKLFLVGFHRSGDSDWMDLYSLDLNAPPPNILKKVDKKHMYCSNGCSFRDGAGVFIASAQRFDVYAVKGLSGDHKTGDTIHVNRFLSP